MEIDWAALCKNIPSQEKNSYICHFIPLTDKFSMEVECC